MLRMAVFAVGAVGDHQIRIDFLDIFADGCGEIRQRDVDATGDAVDFHIRVDVGKKKDILDAQGPGRFADLLLTEGGQILAGGQRRFTDFASLTAGRFQDKDPMSSLSIHGQRAADKKGFIIRMGRNDQDRCHFNSCLFMIHSTKKVLHKITRERIKSMLKKNRGLSGEADGEWIGFRSSAGPNEKAVRRIHFS